MPTRSTPETMTLAGYAATHGATPQAATRWRARGVLTMVAGRVDVAASDRRMRDAGQGRFGTSTAVSVDLPVEPVDTAAIDPHDDAGVTSFLADLLAGRFRSQVAAAAIKENALAAKHLLAFRRDSGELVEMALAEQVLFEASRGVRDAWLNFPVKAAPLVEADVAQGMPLLDALAAQVHRQLADLGEPSADFAARA